MLEFWATRFGKPLGDGPLYRWLDADVVMSEVNQFSATAVTLPAASRRNIAAMLPYTLLEIVQVGVGTIGHGYVLDPRQQVTENDDGTITLELAPLTTEGTWYLTGRGYVRDAALSVIATDLVSFIGTDGAVPSWSFVYRDAATGDPEIALGYENATITGAMIDLATNNFSFIRMGAAVGKVVAVAMVATGTGYNPAAPPAVGFYSRDASVGGGVAVVDASGHVVGVTITDPGAGHSDPVTVAFVGGGGTGAVATATLDGAVGTPMRRFEIGQFGADSGITLCSADGADAETIGQNSRVRLIATVDRSPNGVSGLVNAVVPLGSGSGATQVSVERLWRIVNDPTYPNYGRYGAQAGSLFPEYDHTNYPISDPANQPTGVTQWKFLDANGVDQGQAFTVFLNPPDPDGSRRASAVDSHGAVRNDIQAILWQGAFGTRRPTRDGRFDYIVYDRASCLSPSAGGWGQKWGTYSDPQFSYVDTTAAHQEDSARGLYSGTIANLKRKSQPHHSFACTVANAIGRPPQGGDTVSVEYNRVTADAETGAVVEMAVAETLRVMRVVRSFREGQLPVDTYTLSNLGRFDEDDATTVADLGQKLAQVQIKQQYGILAFAVNDRGNVDAGHPLETPVEIPKGLLRWHRCSLRVDFMAFAATFDTTSGPTPADIEFPDQVAQLSLDHGDHHLAGTGVTDTGIGGTTDGFDLVQTGVDNDAVVQMVVTNDGSSVPDGQNLKAQLVTEGGNARWRLWSSGVPNGRSVGSSMKINFTKAKTQSTFTAAVNKAVAVASKLTAALPFHTHALTQRVPDGPLPPGVRVYVGVDQQYTLLPTTGMTLLSGTRRADGVFTTSFVLDDIAFLANYPGRTVWIKCEPITSTANTYGVGAVRVAGTWEGEIGASVSTSIVAA